MTHPIFKTHHAITLPPIRRVRGNGRIRLGLALILSFMLGMAANKAATPKCDWTLPADLDIGYSPMVAPPPAKPSAAMIRNMAAKEAAKKAGQE